MSIHMVPIVESQKDFLLQQRSAEIPLAQGTCITFARGSLRVNFMMFLAT